MRERCGAHVNTIDDEIISPNPKSAISDSGLHRHRGGGLALGLGLSVFWTCKRDHLDHLHFDVRQYNCIDWIDENDLSSRLTKRIKVVWGGPIPARN
jgi:hypothetical protein